MKRILLLLAMLMPAMAFSQKIKSDSGIIIDLSTDSIHYLNVVYLTKGFSSSTNIVYTDNSQWYFLDESSGKNRKFDNITVVQNYMYKFGWKFVCYIPKASGSITTIMTFEKTAKNEEVRKTSN